MYGSEQTLVILKKNSEQDNIINIICLFSSYIYLLPGGANRVRNESDPHIVTGVLQKTLKELSPSPFYEIYEDILATEINEDSVHARQTVQAWLVNLPQDRFELVGIHDIHTQHEQ